MTHATLTKVPHTDADLARWMLDFMDGLAAVASGEAGLRPTLEWVAAYVKERLQCDEVCIRFTCPNVAPLLQREQVRPSIRDTFVAKRETGLGSWPRKVAESVAEAIVYDRRPLRTRDLLAEPGFAGIRDSETTVRAALVVPLLAEDLVTGVLAASEAKPGRIWTADEQRLLSAIARHCGSVIERTRLREARLENDRLNERAQTQARETRFAAEIQRRLLPAGPLRVEGWEVGGRLVAAAEVCGDGYDFRRLGDQRLFVTIFDVEGKGIPAAMLAVSMQMLLRDVFYGGWSMEEAQRHLCGVITASHSDRMITLVAAELDLASGMLRYYRAGHPYPLVRRHDGRIDELETGGPPLGRCDAVPTAIGHTLLERGDAVLFLTDGILEVFDERGRMFGDAGLSECWGAVGQLALEEAVEHVVCAALDFRGPTSRKHDDDMTAVVLRAPRRG